MNEIDLELWKKLWTDHEEECWSAIIEALKDETKLKEILDMLKEKLPKEEFNQLLDGLVKLK